MNTKNNIVLIGMPGTGKSTTGVLLAKTLGRPFLDTDLLIQQNEKMLLQNIINQKGLEEFLAVEERVVLEFTVKGHVIATGGSVVYSLSAVKHLQSTGLFVYLELPYKEIERRIRNITSRGIAMRKGQKLANLYDERIPLYEKFADITVNCYQKSLEQVVEEIKIKLTVL